MASKGDTPGGDVTIYDPSFFQGRVEQRDDPSAFNELQASVEEILVSVGQQVFREQFVSAVGQAAGWTVESVNPGWASKLTVIGRSPNAAITLSLTFKIGDVNGNYGANNDDNGGLTLIAGTGRVAQLIMSLGSAVGTTGSFKTGNGFLTSPMIAPSRIRFVSGANVDAGQTAQLEFVWSK